MGWKDAPVVGKAAWESAPVVEQQKAAEPAMTRDELIRREVYGALPVALARGMKDVVDTGAGFLSRLGGKEEQQRVRAADAAGRAEFDKATEGMVLPAVARIGGNVAMTAPAASALGGAVAKVMPRLGAAIGSGGMTTGGAPVGAAAKAADFGIRSAGGAVSGGLTASMVNPESAGTGTMIGAAAPGVVQVLGKAGQAAGRAMRGPEQAPELAAAVKAAREAGYVIPPTQARPTMLNRALEGFSGKITTAQNASAQNAAVTQELARKAIGARDLTPEAIQEVRAAANSAYDDLAQVGQFAVDDVFRSRLAGIQPQTLPGTKNADVSALVESLSAPGAFDAQATINTLKQLRFDGFANKASQDPTKKALGSAQVKIAGEIESLIERNLKDAPDLLQNFRQARQTLAKVHTVEKALNKASGSVDAGVIGRELAKGKPLSGELRQIAEFAQQFPKASQTVERMGSLPQTSPLDFAALGTMSAVSSNPAMMAGVFARPAARSLVLSPAIQNRLVQGPRNALLTDPMLELGLLRTAPVLWADR